MFQRIWLCFQSFNQSLSGQESLFCFVCITICLVICLSMYLDLLFRYVIASIQITKLIQPNLYLGITNLSEEQFFFSKNFFRLLCKFEICNQKYFPKNKVYLFINRGLDCIKEPTANNMHVSKLHTLCAVQGSVFGQGIVKMFELKVVP